MWEMPRPLTQSLSNKAILRITLPRRAYGAFLGYKQLMANSNNRTIVTYSNALA